MRTRFNTGVGSVVWLVLAVALVLPIALFAVMTGLIPHPTACCATVPDALAVTVPMAVAMIAAAVFVLAISKPFFIDTVTGVVETRKRTVPFGEIARIVVSSYRGVISMSLTDSAGKRIVAFGLNGGGRTAVGSHQWMALRAAIAASRAPGVENSRAYTRDAPVIPLGEALALIDAEVAALGPNGHSTARGPFARGIGL